MKKSILLIILAFIFTFVNAQVPIKFLGIPVDGTKSKMIEQLKQKGYTYHSLGENEYLEGEFNGQDVHIYVHTNKNKVDRIMVASQHLCGESEIINEFNSLLRKFENNDKYIPTFQYENKYIDKNEDISYEMLVHNKEYRAFFHQVMTKDDADALKKELSENLEPVIALLKSNYENSKDDLEEFKEVFSTLDDDSVSDEEKINSIGILVFTSMMMSNHVWFEIDEYYGQYYLVIFYDNENNRPNGEDL